MEIASSLFSDIYYVKNITCRHKIFFCIKILSIQIFSLVKIETLSLTNKLNRPGFSGDSFCLSQAALLDSIKL